MNYRGALLLKRIKNQVNIKKLSKFLLDDVEGMVGFILCWNPVALFIGFIPVSLTSLNDLSILFKIYTKFPLYKSNSMSVSTEGSLCPLYWKCSTLQFSFLYGQGRFTTI